LTREAAEAGNAQAVHRLAVLAGEGIGETHSWSSALLYLKQAAALGNPLAGGQIAALLDDWPLSQAVLSGQHQPEDLSASADRLDIGSWLNPPPSRVLLPSPPIVSVPQFLSPTMCDWMIERARPALRRAQTFNPRTGGAQVHEGRNHSCIGFGVSRSDLIFAIARARAAMLTGQSLLGFEDTSVLHYAPGEQFAPHDDFIDTSTQAGVREVAATGQRAVTFLAYLNESYEGGETAFPMRGGHYKGKRGEALFCSNVLPDRSPDRRTLHAGTPLKRGEKWLMSQWIRSRPTGGA
jgi:prolyl 4-hydroxylase